MTHRRENHINPSEATVEARRGFEFVDDRLVLTVEPQRELRLVWQRRR